MSTLYSYVTGEALRPATEEEIEDAKTAHEGLIMTEDTVCFVVEGKAW